MKQFKLVFVAAILVISYASNAQLVGLNAFLKGDHVEVGVNKCGVYGTTVNPPAGYHPNWVAGLGFVADSDLDGWDVGSPYNYCGDYFVPGTPEEGWQVQIGGSVYTNASNGCSPSEIPGGIDSYDYTGGLYTVTWEGSIPSEDVTITQVTTLQVDKTYFVTRVLICNDGPTELVDVYYNRNVDPDNEAAFGGDYVTTNTIVFQPPLDPDALISAVGPAGCYLGMGAKDPNSRVSYGAFFTTDGTSEESWNGTGPYSGVGEITEDGATQIAFYIPSILPGECKCLVFAYILNEADLEEALDATVTYNVTAGGDIIASGDSSAVCNAGDTISLEIIGANDYDWTWSPSTGLNVDTGISVIATVTETTEYTITGVGGFCGDAVLTVTVFVDSLENLVDAGADYSICLGDETTFEADAGPIASTIFWTPDLYLDCTDCEDPTLTPTEAGEYTYTLNAVTKWGCPGSDDITLTVNPLPVVDAGDDTNVCPEGSVPLEATGAVEYEWTPSTGLSCDDCPDPDCTVNDFTVYTVTGTDANGCVNTDEIEVSVFSELEIFATADPETIDIYLGQTSQLDVTGAETYSWAPSSGLSATNIANPIAAPNDTMTYVVTGIDENGCIATDTVTVYVIGELAVGIPTAFSPNGDGFNDNWAPAVTGSGYVESYMIYNRYGELVYQGSSGTPGWNGIYNGELQGIGTFVVNIKAVTSLGEQRDLKGSFTLVR
jgi:gliding motility-associated-like protein